MNNSVPGPKPGRESNFPVKGYTTVDGEIYNSVAFNALTGFAPQLLIHILAARRKRRHKQGGGVKNPDALNFSYSQAHKLGVTDKRLVTAYDQLLAYGFISLVNQGGGYGKEMSRYRLVGLYLNWTPGKVFEVRPKGRMGYCKTSFNRPRKTKSTDINVRGTTDIDVCERQGQKIPIQT